MVPGCISAQIKGALKVKALPLLNVNIYASFSFTQRDFFPKLRPETLSGATFSISLTHIELVVEWQYLLDWNWMSAWEIR